MKVKTKRAPTNFPDLRKANDMKAKTKRAPSAGKTQTKNASTARKMQTINLIHELNAFLYANQRMLLAIFIQLQESQKRNTQLDQVVLRRINALDIEKNVDAIDYLAGTLASAAAFATTERKMSVNECETIDGLVLRAAAKIDIKSIREFAETLQRDLISSYTAAKKTKT